MPTALDPCLVSTRWKESCASPPSSAAAPLAFIEDDYGRAVAEAKRQKLPLFIDVWAPWCHTCLSMREYIFTDERLRKHGAEFVWLSIDLENDKNADFLARFPAPAVPTLWVLDPETEKPALRWMGTATAPEVLTLLEDAAAAVRHGDASGGDAAVAFVRGKQAAAAGKLEDAAAAFREALQKSDGAWPKRASTVEALAGVLQELGLHAECVALALEEAPRMPRGTSLVTLLTLSIESVADLPEDTGKVPVEQKKTLIRLGHAVAADPNVTVLADDRSGLFEVLVAITRKYQGPEAAAPLAREWATFLEGEAARASTPAARAVFDAHRLLAYLELGKPEIEAKAIPMLTASQRDLPRDYNPPARLARAYFELGRTGDALSAIDRALPLAYGGRTLRLFSLKADILKSKGDGEGEKRALDQAIALAKTLHLTPGYAKVAAAIEKRRAGL